MKLTKYNIKENNKLLNIALTHSSYAYEHGGEHYERLEFLGDAVLQLIISDYFYKKTKLSEGEMSKIRASFVCESALYIYSQDAGIIPKIKLAQGLQKGVTESIAADVFESVIGALYLNSGYVKAKEFVMDITLPYLEKGEGFNHDYKSSLQELVHTTKETVVYNVLREKGPAHNKVFEIEAVVDGIVYGKGKGKSKKEAEQNAAHDAILKKAGDK
ncbi:MAG: ribonuclease III [Bacilli bacterium]|nr:ribonuclease III [Bacilli bacterium]MDD4795335.1 ribonuclease III [Bacilli bacterium]